MISPDYLFENIHISMVEKAKRMKIFPKFRMCQIFLNVENLRKGDIPYAISRAHLVVFLKKKILKRYKNILKTNHYLLQKNSTNLKEKIGKV